MKSKPLHKQLISLIKPISLFIEHKGINVSDIDREKGAIQKKALQYVERYRDFVECQTLDIKSGIERLKDAEYVNEIKAFIVHMPVKNGFDMERNRRLLNAHHLLIYVLFNNDKTIRRVTRIKDKQPELFKINRI